MKAKLMMFVLLLLLNGSVFGKCASWTNSETERVNRAKTIFVAEIIEAHVDNDKYGIAEKTYGKYRLIETIKGKPKRIGQVESMLGIPGIAFTPGTVYLFVIYDDSSFVDWCGGTRILNDYYAPYENDDRKLIRRLKGIVAGKMGARAAN